MQYRIENNSPILFSIILLFFISSIYAEEAKDNGNFTQAELRLAKKRIFQVNKSFKPSLISLQYNLSPNFSIIGKFYYNQNVSESKSITAIFDPLLIQGMQYNYTYIYFSLGLKYPDFQ